MNTPLILEELNSACLRLDFPRTERLEEYSLSQIDEVLARLHQAKIKIFRVKLLKLAGSNHTRIYQALLLTAQMELESMAVPSSMQ